MKIIEVFSITKQCGITENILHKKIPVNYGNSVSYGEMEAGKGT